MNPSQPNQRIPANFGNRCRGGLAVLVCLAAAWAALVAPAAPAAPPSTQPDRWDEEQYSAAYMNGRRIGYMAQRQRALPGGGSESFMGFKLSLAVAGQTVSVTITQQQVESADGKPASFSEYELLGPMPIRREGVIRNGQLELTSTQGDQTLTKRQKWDDRVQFESATRKTLMAQLKADGDEAVIWDYNADAPGDGFAPSTHHRVGYEQITVNGKGVRALHVTTSNPTLPAVTHDWYDDSFQPVAGQAVLGPGMMVRTEACSKAFAHQRFNAPEIFANNLIRLDRPLKDVEKIRSLRLTLVFSKPLDEPLAIPQTDRQRVIESTRQRLVVELTRSAYPKPPAGGDPPLDGPLKEYLQAADQFNTNDPEIQAGAKQAVGQQVDPVAKGRAIRNWVDERLTFKEMGVASGTASDVIRSRTGDCTEHSALLVALARAAGIPARTVQGLGYAAMSGGSREGSREGSPGVLGGHMWAQLYLHGRWVDFDAALPGDPAHIGRLAIAFGSADGKFDMSAGAALYKLFGNVKSALVEQVKTD